MLFKDASRIFKHYLPDVVLVDYRHAKRTMFATLSKQEFRELKKLPFVIGELGEVFINGGMAEWELYVQYFVCMNDVPTKKLTEALSEAQQKFPDVKNSLDILKYTSTEELREIGFLQLIPWELERRKRSRTALKDRPKTIQFPVKE